jgi:hypothetical protein
MSWARYEFDPDAFEVVVRTVERLDFQFASITGTGIDVANAEGSAQNLQQIFVKRFDDWNFFERSWRRLRQYPRANHA